MEVTRCHDHTDVRCQLAYWSDNDIGSGYTQCTSGNEVELRIDRDERRASWLDHFDVVVRGRPIYDSHLGPPGSIVLGWLRSNTSVDRSASHCKTAPVRARGGSIDPDRSEVTHEM
jgi:hypothetical protein